MIPVPDLRVHRRRDQLDPTDDRRLRAAVAAGEWTRITAGSYTPLPQWAGLKPHERHLVLVAEVARRMRPGAVFGFAAAASIWGMDLLGSWPSLVDVRTERTTGGRTHGAVRRHALGLESVELVPWGRHFVTTPAQTALDLARSLPFVNGVAAVDQALWARRRGGALVTIEQLHSLLDRSPAPRGDARARHVLAEATHLADNVRETDMRMLMLSLGFPRPRLQMRLVLPSGRVAFGDFFFERYRHWAELDGRGKYLDLAMLAGRTTAEAVIAEKNRENEIRRCVRGFTRVEPADLQPRRLYDILTGDGLPSSLPRP